jgi:2-keto-4-pentenoate hydratase
VHVAEVEGDDLRDTQPAQKPTRGNVVSTGTCTGHCFVAVGDRVEADFWQIGYFEAVFEP